MRWLILKIQSILIDFKDCRVQESNKSAIAQAIVTTQQ